ncbi:C-type lectin domain family 4 member G [Pipistrellus kuhlii]|uniref:C-type lectin domain family 4 member G n=1 Tax=Pipistrellus kuhlii TaxID=59472 RepID=A0A7J7U9M0_PIPKU|nr:C-type lectin domain family 4 member G [Pipistrellus kuhlii]KAF6309538.1 C-type lectin domain family 4 member G [Pipistrellus kuhlii]
MDTVEFCNVGDRLEGVPAGSWGRWGPWVRRVLLLALALLAITVLWTLILSILLSKASKQQGALLGGQDLLRANASKQTVMLGELKGEVGACHSCCLGTQEQLKTAQEKLLQHESALRELNERVTQRLAEAGRDREGIRSELFRALEAARFGNSSCEPCPAQWLPFRGSCYLFSEQQATWEGSQSFCAGVGAHLVIVGDLEEQSFLTRNTRGRGFWLGLRAVRRGRKVQGYQWVDGVPLSFSYWNRGEPNDDRGQEDCVMMLHTGLWNDAPCSSERDNWICEKRNNC